MPTADQPHATDEFVAYERPGESSVLMRPHEAEALAMSLLGAASEARAYAIAEDCCPDTRSAIDAEPADD